MLPSAALRSGFAPCFAPQHFRKCCAPKSRLPGAVGLPQLVSLRNSTKMPWRHARWRCNGTVDSSRPAPVDEPLRSGDTPDAQAEAPSPIYAKDSVVDGRRKGIALMEELKELVKSSNAELKAELQQQLEGVLSSSRDSTEQLLRQVLGAVEELKVQLQRVDSRTAEAMQHAMAAAASAAAVQQQQQQQQQSALAEGIKAMVGAAAAALAAANQQGAIREAVTAASQASSTALGQQVGGKEGAAGPQQQRQEQQQERQQQTPSLQQLIDSAVFFDEYGFTSGMCSNATRAAAHAICKGMPPKDIAGYIRKRFDDVYGKSWQCVVVQGGVAGESVNYWDAACGFTVSEWTVYLWRKSSD